MNLETFETSRLILKKFSPEDFNYIFENFQKDQIMQLLGHDSPEAFSKEKAKYEKGYSTYNRSLLYFQIIDKESMQVIGGCGFHNWYTDHRRAELGYALTNESFKKSGIMSETLEFVIRYGFTKMNLHRMEAFVAPENIASLKLMEKFHFQREGLMKEHYYTNGQFEDSVAFARLASPRDL